MSALALDTELRSQPGYFGSPAASGAKLFRPDYKFVRDDNQTEIAVEGLDVYIGDNHILKNVNVAIPIKR